MKIRQKHLTAQVYGNQVLSWRILFFLGVTRHFWWSKDWARWTLFWCKMQRQKVETKAVSVKVHDNATQTFNNLTQAYINKVIWRRSWFHMAFVPWGKVCIQLFSLQLWINSRIDSLFNFVTATGLGEGKLWKNNFVSHPAHAEGLGKCIWKYSSMQSTSFMWQKALLDDRETV